MTTETLQDARRTSVSMLLRSSAAALVAGVLVSVAGLLLDGERGLLAGALGTAVVVAVLFSGSLVVSVVAEVMPSASLMVALMTYTLQMALLALILIPLGNSTWATDHLTARWLAGAVIAGALIWTVAQVLLATRARIPVFDLPAPRHPAKGSAR